MSYLSMMEARLPPGFRFHPRDEELVCDYLINKIAGDTNSLMMMMIDVDLNRCEPWDLPEMACVGGKEWYFFNLRDRKYATGQRTNRATVSGYWKATGKDRLVTRRGVVVGMRKTLVFYQGRAPKGTKTDWVMHEFRLQSPPNVPNSSSKEDWVLCRVFYKSRALPLKPTMATTSCYEDATTSSSSLPPLMGDTNINFNGHTSPMGFEGYHEQKPCSSNPASGGPPVAPVTAHFEPDVGSGLDSDKMVMRAVLNHFTTKAREPFPSMEEGNIDSCFNENGLYPMW